MAGDDPSALWTLAKTRLQQLALSFLADGFPLTDAGARVTIHDAIRGDDGK